MLTSPLASKLTSPSQGSIVSPGPAHVLLPRLELQRAGQLHYHPAPACRPAHYQQPLMCVYPLHVVDQLLFAWMDNSPEVRRAGWGGQGAKKESLGCAAQTFYSAAPLEPSWCQHAERVAKCSLATAVALPTQTNSQAC